jgi:hypothetical protein
MPTVLKLEPGTASIACPERTSACIGNAAQQTIGGAISAAATAAKLNRQNRRKPSRRCTGYLITSTHQWQERPAGSPGKF